MAGVSSKEGTTDMPCSFLTYKTINMGRKLIKFSFYEEFLMIRSENDYGREYEFLARYVDYVKEEMELFMVLESRREKIGGNKKIHLI